MHQDAACLMRAVRPGSSQAWRRSEHARRHLTRYDLEVAALGDRRLMDVTPENQFRARRSQTPPYFSASRERPLPCAPRSTGKLVVQHHDTEGLGRSSLEPCDRAVEVCAADPAALIGPGRDRAQSHHLQSRARVDGIHAPVPLECSKCVQQACRRKHRDVVVARDDQEGRSESAKVSGRRLVLARSAPVGEVSARDDNVRRDTLDEARNRTFERRIVEAVPRAEMEIRHVEDAR